MRPEQTIQPWHTMTRDQLFKELSTGPEGLSSSQAAILHSHEVVPPFRLLARLWPRLAVVIRDGREIKVSVEYLVPGDVVMLQAGDRIPADMRLIIASGAQVDESTLVDKSAFTDKTAGPESARSNQLPSMRKNLIFKGTKLLTGHAVGIVVRLRPARLPKNGN